MWSHIIALGITIRHSYALAVERQAAAVTFTDTYDALSTGSPVGLLHGLQYNGPDVTTGRSSDGGQPIVPHSKPKFAESNVKLEHTQSGGISFDSYITINAGQNVSSFDLYRFWFACATFDGTTYGPAQPCTLAVTGLGDGTRHYMSTFDYDPASQGATFVEAVFNYPTFRQIQNVSVGIVTGSTPAGRTAVAIDSLEHINYA